MRVDGDLDEEAGNRFRRDGRLASLGEERGVIDLLAGVKRQHTRADTKNLVCVAQYTETLMPFFFFTRKTSVGSTGRTFLKSE